jgi:hypothetical protein
MNLDWPEARIIYDELSSLSANGVEPFDRLWDDLLRAATRYANLRVQWALTPPGKERGDYDRQRTLAHNVLIDSCNAMSRAMSSQGLDIAWRKQLGDHRTREGRKTIGDFACFVHCLLGVSAR